MEHYGTSFPISIWIGLLIAVYIILAGGTILEAIVIGVIVSVVGGVILYFVKTKLDEKREGKKRHNKVIVYDVFKKFIDMRIKYTSGFNVLLQEVDILRNENNFYLALEHLKAYQNSWKGWEKLEEINKQLKIKWEKLDSR
jgi:hypothetical protein